MYWMVSETEHSPCESRLKLFASGHVLHGAANSSSSRTSSCQVSQLSTCLFWPTNWVRGLSLSRPKVDGVVPHIQHTNSILVDQAERGSALEVSQDESLTWQRVCLAKSGDPGDVMGCVGVQ